MPPERAIATARPGSIPGGVHPDNHKAMSLGAPITSAGMPDRLALALNQHIGAPSKPVVATGERVLKGQVVARTEGAISARVHASTSGEVTAVGNHPLAHPSGMSAPCVMLRPDGEDRWIELDALANWREAPATTLLSRVRDAGVVGMGGAGFPTAPKLSANAIHTVLINGTECEPYITSDEALMRERADSIVAGMEVLVHLLAAREALIGIENDKREAVEAMQRAVAGHPSCRVIPFPPKYPSGGERQLIQILTGQEVPSGQLPAALGIVCQNVDTVASIYRAVVEGRPLLSRITTVTGHAVSRPGNYETLIGTPVRHLLELAGWRAEDTDRLVMGGAMMGFELQDTEAAVVKTTNCVLAMTAAKAPREPERACIRCGMCAVACPASLLPQQLYWYAQGKDHEQLERYRLFDCIECGACAYVCPSHIPLVQYYRASKASIVQRQRDQALAERSKSRFEFHQQRAEAEKKARERRRGRRGAKKLADADADLLKAAVAQHPAPTDGDGGDGGAP